MPEFLNVQEVLSHLELRPDMKATEFGCGSAMFTITLAQKLSKGKVFALDVQEEKLSALTSRAAMMNLSNITTILCDLEAPKGSTLSDASLDVVLIPNVLFQAQDKHAILEESVRILKSGGQLLVVDWLKKPAFSPKDNMVLPQEVKDLVSKQGLQLKEEFAAGDYHYGLLFTKWLWILPQKRFLLDSLY